MYIALGLIIVLACVLMILVVMIQNSKGGGISSAFGASAATQVLGARRGNELIEKITWGLAISLAVLAISGNLLLSLGTTSETNLRMGNSIENQVIDNAIQMPDQSTFEQAPSAPAEGE